MSSSSPAHTAAVAVFTVLLLCATGCSGTRGSVSSSALAPGMRGEVAGSRMARNVANPNGPFAVVAPHLAVREPLLDVNGVPSCAPQQLSLFESRAEINGVHHAVRLTLENSGSACRLSGFPSITLLQADGSVLGGVRIEKVSSSAMRASLTASSVMQEAAALDTPSPQVLLPARGEAAFEVGWTSGPRCAEVSRIAIAAPGMVSSVQNSTMQVAHPIQICEDQVLITAISQPDIP